MKSLSLSLLTFTLFLQAHLQKHLALEAEVHANITALQKLDHDGEGMVKDKHPNEDMVKVCLIGEQFLADETR